MPKSSTRHTPKKVKMQAQEGALQKVQAPKHPSGDGGDAVLIRIRGRGGALLFLSTLGTAGGIEMHGQGDQFAVVALFVGATNRLADKSGGVGQRRGAAAVLDDGVRRNAQGQIAHVSNLTLSVTSDTVIKNRSRSATLADAAGLIGKPIRGTYKKSDDGKLVALTVHLNSSGGSKGGKKKKRAAAAPDTN